MQKVYKFTYPPKKVYCKNKLPHDFTPHIWGSLRRVKCDSVNGPSEWFRQGKVDKRVRSDIKIEQTCTYNNWNKNSILFNYLCVRYRGPDDACT